MTLPFFGSGVVELPPEGFKRAKNSSKMQMCFFVHEGKVLVEVGPTSGGEMNTFAISRGGVWVVPRGKLLSPSNPDQFSSHARSPSEALDASLPNGGDTPPAALQYSSHGVFGAREQHRWPLLERVVSGVCVRPAVQITLRRTHPFCSARCCVRRGTKGFCCHPCGDACSVPPNCLSRFGQARSSAGGLCDVALLVLQMEASG